MARLSWPGSLVTYKDGLPVLKTVTHPSTNWARRWLTSLMRPTTLPTEPSHHRFKYYTNKTFHQHAAVVVDSLLTSLRLLRVDDHDEDEDDDDNDCWWCGWFCSCCVSTESTKQPWVQQVGLFSCLVFCISLPRSGAVLCKNNLFLCIVYSSSLEYTSPLLCLWMTTSTSFFTLSASDFICFIN